MVPTPSTPGRRTKQKWLVQNGIIAVDQPPSFRIDPLREIVVLNERPNVFELAVVLVHHEHKAALVQVNNLVLAVPVYEEKFVSGVVVPKVMVDLLSVPFQLSSL